MLRQGHWLVCRRPRKGVHGVLRAIFAEAQARRVVVFPDVVSLQDGR